MIRLKRLGTSRYATRDGRFLIENDHSPTLVWTKRGGRWTRGVDRAWFVYDGTRCNLEDAGISDPSYEGDTLRVCREFIEQQYAKETAS